MITREFNLYLHAGHSIPLVINANQYDHGEQWLFKLFNSDGTQYVPSSGAIVGIKSDNLGIINSGTVDSQGRVVINETQQMTAAVGKAVFELVIDDGTHGTANFVVLVEAKPGDQADLSETDISMIEQAIEAASTIKPYGSPLVASTVAGMTDHDKVYVYVGSETGYTSGHWYYYDGDSWEDGGVYNSVAVQTDTTLTLSGVAADAKKTGDEINDLKSQIESSTGMTDEFKTALENLVNHLLFDESDPTGQTYITALHDAMYPPAQLVSISAVYGGGSVVQGTAINDLKDDLTVTGLYDDESTEIIASTDYTLSGDLNTVGTATITVAYEDQTTTFTVTVEEVEALLYELASTVSTKNYSTGVKLWSPEPISHTILCETTFANSGWSGKQAVLSHGNQSNDRQYRVGHDLTLNYKTALLIGTQGVSLFASSASTKRRFAYSYNATTGEVKAYAKNSGGDISALKTFTAGTVNASEDTLTLNSGVTGTTNPVSVLKVYGKILSEQDMYDFVDALE